MARHLHRLKHYFYKIIAAEISSISRYYDKVIQWKVLPHDSGILFDLIDCAKKIKLDKHQEIPDLRSESEIRSIILLNGTLNHSLDIQSLLTGLKCKLSRTSRVVAVAYNPYLRSLYWIANKLGMRKGEEPKTFTTTTDINNIAKISGFEVAKIKQAVYSPFSLLGLGTVVNRVMSVLPILRWLCFTNIIVFRPIIPEKTNPSLSILIPARNEEGNIENALKRIPQRDDIDLEIIFVEGNSQDQTWAEIQRVIPLYDSKFKIKAFQQSGKGKGDAVRLGFSHASGDLLTILDADLTMPPEQLFQFYEAYCKGLADFVNGSRLVYPMEGEAMRFLNRYGNVFFAKALSFVLGVKVGDSLCGTKLFSRHDYLRMIAWRKDFGDFDPFGDFEILFPASVFALGIVDIPIHYKARTYGSTNISRFQNGWMLLKMTLVGFFSLRLGKIGK